MVSKKFLSGALLVIAALCLMKLLPEIQLRTQTKNYNAAIAAGDYAAARQWLGDYGLFAAAYAEQGKGEYKAARALYNELESSSIQGLQVASFYNLGNSYMEQAANLDLNADADRVVPLIELAKGSYRKALQLDSLHWNARHNLEKALLLVPDANPQVPMVNEGQSELVRTVISADTEENLP